MPNRTVYIRKVDEELFSKLYSPDWMHDKLNEKPFNPTYIQDAKTVRVNLPTLTIPVMGKDIDIIHPDTISRIPSRCAICNKFACECSK